MFFWSAVLIPSPCHHSVHNHMSVTKSKVVPELGATIQKTICQLYKFLTLAQDRQAVSSPYPLPYWQWQDLCYATRRRLSGLHCQFGNYNQKKSHSSSLIAMLT